jgi:hypothetical protein
MHARISERLCGAAQPRTRLALDLAMIALAATVTACSGGDSTSPPPPPQDQWNAVAARAWTMPAETEGYKCVGVHVTSDGYFTGFRVASPSDVPNEVYLTVTSGNVTDGPFDCGAGSLGAELLYAASRGNTSIEFPTGFGVHVLAGQNLLLNIHLVNPADTSATDSMGVEARIGTAADVTTPIDMSLAGTFLINIPSDGQLHTATGQCAAGNAHLLAILPMMRSRAVHQTLTSVVDTDSQTIFDQDFDWAHNGYTMLATPFAIPAGANLRTVCSYVNNSGTTMNYGESTNNESCFSAVYRYPLSVGQLFSCAEGQSLDIRRE